jgi:hypothetical protein
MIEIAMFFILTFFDVSNEILWPRQWPNSGNASSFLVTLKKKGQKWFHVSSRSEMLIISEKKCQTNLFQQGFKIYGLAYFPGLSVLPRQGNSDFFIKKP